MPEAAGPLGILGGTFDPVHRAHVNLARGALRQLRLSGVLWIPAGRTSHREQPHAAAAHRLEMVKLAAAGDPAFRLDAGEALAETPSYTVPTLERLRREHGEERPFVLLMGADAFRGLASWHRWRELLALAHIGVAARPGADLAAAALAPELADLCRAHWSADADALAAAPAGRIVGFEIDPVAPPDLSATLVRDRLRRDDAAAADLLPPGVLDYIRRHRLYSSG
jgi:nicotinate-nucleotide adenylyltransferase